jgi:phosphopentomutase
LIVLDGVGCGESPDAESYGDAGADTLGNLSRRFSLGLTLPHLQGLGLGCLTSIVGCPPVANPEGLVAKLAEASAGKDTTTGHWEMAGLVTKDALPTFPQGFPSEMIDEFTRLTGYGVLGNRPASGTAILDELGPNHLRTKRPIVYTSADSVFQIAAHEEAFGLDELYRVCELARTLCDRYRIGRVIARPFVGDKGAFVRTYNRRDYAMPPPESTVLNALGDAGVEVVGVGKIEDIFARRGVARSFHTEGNADGLVKTLELAQATPSSRQLVFVNLVDFDMLYGHRNDVQGFAKALGEFDRFVPLLRSRLRPGDLAMLTADHGNDPTTPSTDHSREYVPLLAFGPALPATAKRNLGARSSFCDIAQTLSTLFGLPPWSRGESLLPTP